VTHTPRTKWEMQLGMALGALVTAILILTGPKLYAQLQQSGGPGSTVTIGAALPVGTNVIGKMSIDQTTPGTTNLVQIGSTLPAFASTPTFNVGTMAALVAGSATIGVVVPKTPCGTTVGNQALIAVPTSATAVFAATTCLMTAYFNNTNGTPQTVTLTDNAGTPLNGIGPAFSIPALSNLFLSYDGVQFTSGVKWAAGGAGVTGAMWGFQ
jgi:hypothetical protein